MIGEVGLLLLVSTFFFSLLLVSPLRFPIKTIAFLNWLSALSAFFLLMVGYIISDFSISNVYNNSHSMKPLIYKITGTWGNHEGSMLLAILVIASFLLHLAYKFDNSHPAYKTAVRFQSFIMLGFVAFSLFTSNPFIQLNPIPNEGRGLNPLLQDLGLAVHPPMLYVGYLGYSVVFALAIANLLHKKEDKPLTLAIRNYSLFSWSFLTLGIALGSWWAYRELGWGGYWFWDPVENASFMPWLIGTALLHSIIVVEKKRILVLWTLFLALLTFSLSMIGLFLVRSGIITSVHAFSNDPARGVYILAFLCLLVGGSLAIFSIQARNFSNKNNLRLFSKEGGLLINNMMFLVLCGVVLIGTLYPLMLQLFAGKFVSVGAPYFNKTFNPIAVTTVILAAIFPYIRWKNDSFRKGHIIHFINTTSAIILAIFIKFYFEQGWLIACSLAISYWLILSMIILLVKRIRQQNNKSLWKRLITIPPRFYSMIIAHFSIALLIIGISYLSGWSKEKELLLAQGESVNISDYRIKLNSMSLLANDNYLARQGDFSISYKSEDKILTRLYPEVRYYPVEKKNTTESALHYHGISNVYLTLGDVSEDGKFAVRVYYRPAVTLLWIASIMLVISGFIALRGRK